VPPILASKLPFLEICGKELDGKFKELGLAVLLSVYTFVVHSQCLRWGLRLS
jgi:hypothetical protein